MSARTARQEARARILAVFTGQLERFIPEDESVSLKGATFADFEDPAESLAQATLPVVLEERAALEPNAEVETAGRCPHCGSEGVYLEPEVTQPEVRSRQGPVVLSKQHARCRSCGGSFSPSGSGVGIAGGSSVDASCRTTGGAGRCVALLRSSGAGVERGLGHTPGRQADSALVGGHRSKRDRGARCGGAGVRARMLTGVTGQRAGALGDRDGRRSGANP